MEYIHSEKMRLVIRQFTLAYIGIKWAEMITSLQILYAECVKHFQLSADFTQHPVILNVITNDDIMISFISVRNIYAQTNAFHAVFIVLFVILLNLSQRNLSNFFTVY